MFQSPYYQIQYMTLKLNLCVCVCVYVRVHVYVCVRERERGLTHNREALVKVLPQWTSLSCHGGLEIDSKQHSEEHTQQHQQQPGQTLVDVIRVMTFIIPASNRSCDDSHGKWKDGKKDKKEKRKKEEAKIEMLTHVLNLHSGTRIFISELCLIVFVHCIHNSIAISKVAPPKRKSFFRFYPQKPPQQSIIWFTGNKMNGWQKKFL